MRARGRRIPIAKIEITVPRTRRFFAPGIAALRFALRRSIRRAVKLRLRRQLPPQPVCIRCRFRVAYVCRPTKRKTGLPEHRAVHPQISVALPENGMLDSFLLSPGPIFLSPERGVFISSCLDETQKIPVGHVAR